MSVQREFHEMFPTPVLVARVPGGDELNAALRTDIATVRAETPNGRPEAWACDVYTTISNNAALHQRPGFRRLNARFLEGMAAFGKAMGYPLDKADIAIDMCWLNIYGRQHSQERHTHRTYPFVAIYYVAAPPGCSPLILHAPTADWLVRPPCREATTINRSYVSITPEPGMLLVFAGHVRHAVAPSTIDAERISVSANAGLIGKRVQ